MARDRALAASLLKLASMDRSDWHATMQEILRIDADVLSVERVSYWALVRDPMGLYCEKGYIAGEKAFERGRVFAAEEIPAYFHEISEATLVAIEDASSDPRTRDLAGYLSDHGIRALLDVPIWVRGELVGVLCHEHVGERRRWTDGDVDFAVSVSQVVASAFEARGRNHAERAERRARFLDRCSRTLATSLDPTEIAQSAAALVVPELGDGVLVDVLDDAGKLVRLAILYSSPEGFERWRGIDRRFPPDIEGPHFSALVIRSGEAFLVPEVGKKIPAGFGFSPEHARAIEDLGLRSAIGVPLREGTRTIGAIAFGAEQGRYDHDDLLLAEELAVRVGAALSNARLHAKTQEALRVRDELVSLAAHELHGPLASLQLAAESLAAQDAAPEPVRAHVEPIVRQVHGLIRRVDQVLAT